MNARLALTTLCFSIFLTQISHAKESLYYLVQGDFSFVAQKGDHSGRWFTISVRAKTKDKGLTREEYLFYKEYIATKIKTTIINVDAKGGLRGCASFNFGTIHDELSQDLAGHGQDIANVSIGCKMLSEKRRNIDGDF